MEFSLGLFFFATVAVLAFACWNLRAPVRRAPPAIIETAIEEATAELVVEGLPAAPPAPPPPPPLPLSVEEIHRKYEGMKDTDPREAGRLIYAELLAVHGR